MTSEPTSQDMLEKTLEALAVQAEGFPYPDKDPIRCLDRLEVITSLLSHAEEYTNEVLAEVMDAIDGCQHHYKQAYRRAEDLQATLDGKESDDATTE